MLVDVRMGDRGIGSVLGMIAVMGRRNSDVERLSQGFYEVGHWNFEHTILDKVNSYPEFSGHTVHDGDRWFSSYGVCDSPAQFAAEYGDMLANDPRRFVVSFVQLLKANESPEGGWRWRKWGPYVGNQFPRCEYLHDEPDITEVWTYQCLRGARVRLAAVD